MPRYIVPMFGSSQATAHVVVDAKTPAAAQEKAFRDVRDGEIDVEWEHDAVDALHAGEPTVATQSDLATVCGTTVAKRNDPIFKCRLSRGHEGDHRG